MSEELLLRRFQAYQAAGDVQGATQMVEAWLIQNPGSRTALRLQAMLVAQAGDTVSAVAILNYLRRSGSDRDVQLLTDLALLQLGSGAPDAAEDTAIQAYRLQRASPLAGQTLALSYATLGVSRQRTSALIAKARQMLGDNPVLAQARERLNQNRLTPLAAARVARAPVARR
jgi:hypothetical protein